MQVLHHCTNPCNTLIITRNEERKAVRVRSSALLFSHYLQAKRVNAVLRRNACLVQLTATVPQPCDCQPEPAGFTKMVVAGSTPCAQARLGSSARPGLRVQVQLDLRGERP
jgi:hypothetical protein